MKNVIITYGGFSCEHDISIITALTAYNASKSQRIYNIILVYMKNGRFYVGDKLSKMETYISFCEKGLREVVFKNGKMIEIGCFFKKTVEIYCALVCNHGGAGENGSLSGFFELSGIPYTCSGVLGSSVCMDKVFSKYLLQKFKMPVVEYKVFCKSDDIEILEQLGYPVIIKPANLGSSVGIAYANSKEELLAGIKFAFQFDQKLLVERALTDFEEYNCAVVDTERGVITSDIERPVFNKQFLNFYDKYIASEEIKREINPFMDKKIKDRILRLSKEIYCLFDLKGVVRIDYLYAEGRLYVNEINTVPGSLAFYLFKSDKLDFYSIIASIIEKAVETFQKKANLFTDFSSNVLQSYCGNKLKAGSKK